MNSMNQSATSQSQGDMKSMCRVCHKYFLHSENHPRACRVHPESFTGETAQRWLAPGDTKDAGEIHYFYSCCGSPDINSPGCCHSMHVGFDEVEDVCLRLPGKGVETGEDQL
mmetsp:Transcript_16714/g.25110  ORF Transcript_16714/g.25110 Transcript_16714/m.25110 type:complete len:112 (-) Transcript_16714:94-429(-)